MSLAYDPHRPWLLVSYRPGGGKPKQVVLFASQSEAAVALRQAIRAEDGGPGERYAFRVKHVTGRFDLWLALGAIDRVEYTRLARTQARVSGQSRLAYGSRLTRKASKAAARR